MYFLFFDSYFKINGVYSNYTEKKIVLFVLMVETYLMGLTKGSFNHRLRVDLTFFSNQ